MRVSGCVFAMALSVGVTAVFPRAALAQSVEAQGEPLAAPAAPPTPAPEEEVAGPVAKAQPPSTMTADVPPAEAAAAPAPAEEEEKNHSFSIALNQDIFFGFYPTAALSYALSPELAITSYGILWTRPSFGTDAGGGGLWTEFGAGAAFTVLDGKLRINPQVGVLNGKLLSGGSRALVGEGVVPNITVDYSDDLLEGQFYMGYYIALREPRTNDFLHYWANAGVKATKFLSAGVHWEHLILSRTRGGDAANIYQWIGPYFQFSLPNSSAIRFSGGFDVADKGQKDFYKVSFVKTF